MSMRWASWRRDLLFTLAGALVASAVLVPIGWWQLRAERHRAESAEVEAAHEREQNERARAELAEARARSLTQQLLIESQRADAFGAAARELAEKNAAIEAWNKAARPKP